MVSVEGARSAEPLPATTRIDVLQLIRVPPDDFAPYPDSECALVGAVCKGRLPCPGCGDCGRERCGAA